MKKKSIVICLTCLCAPVYLNAAQICMPGSILPSTPNEQLIDNNDGTVYDLKTGLMWKKCIEGKTGNTCATGSALSFSWQKALQRAIDINSGGGFAGYNDWRVPNVRELLSIVEDQCNGPSINLTRFPNTPSASSAWSISPYAGNEDQALSVYFGYGFSSGFSRNTSMTVRLVRGGN